MGGEQLTVSSLDKLSSLMGSEVRGHVRLNATAYLRIPFVIDTLRAWINETSNVLQRRFVAYLNGYPCDA